VLGLLNSVPQANRADPSPDSAEHWIPLFRSPKGAHENRVIADHLRSCIPLNEMNSVVRKNNLADNERLFLVNQKHLRLFSCPTFAVQTSATAMDSVNR
jgi:hypothetical protein